MTTDADSPESDKGTLMWRLILLMALVSLPVAGGEVYKCKGPKGEITFTNIKCPAHTDTEHYASYQPEPEPPPPAPIAAEAAPPDFSTVNSAAPVDQPVSSVVPSSVSPLAQPSTSPAAQPPLPSDPSIATAAPNTAAGYKCSDGENMWLQSTPCPPASARAASRPSQPSTPAAAPGAAATAAVPSPATPPGVPSQGVLCDQLIAQAASPERRKDGAGSDELNNLLVANGCKR